MVYKAGIFLRRDFQTQASYRLDFIMRLARIIIATAIFYFISQTVGTAVNPYLQPYDTDYFHFALLGVAFYPFINLSISSLADVVGRYQHNGTLEMLFLSPTSILTTLSLSTLWGYCWALLQALGYLLVATFFFQAYINWSNLFAALLIVLLAVAANIGLGFINAGFVLVTKRPSPLVNVMALSTNLLAGLYFPVEVLPAWLRGLSYLLPATYSLNALRRTMLQETSLFAVGRELLILSSFALVLLPLGLFIFHYAIRWAKRDGSLTQY